MDYAKANLNEAVDYLEKVAKGDDEVARKAAADLVSEVRDLHQDIKNGDKALSVRLESSWQRIEALSERSAETISTGWQRLRAEGPGKKALIDAKLQLAYVRIDHVYAKDDAAARVELAEAQGQLKTAREQSQPAIGSDLKDVATLLRGLEGKLADNGDKSVDAAGFQQAEARLAELIRRI